MEDLRIKLAVLWIVTWCGGILAPFARARFSLTFHHFLHRETKALSVCGTSAPSWGAIEVPRIKGRGDILWKI